MFGFAPSLFWLQVDSRFHSSQNKLMAGPAFPKTKIIKFSAFRLFIYFTFIRGQNLEKNSRPIDAISRRNRRKCAWLARIDSKTDAFIICPQVVSREHIIQSQKQPETGCNLPTSEYFLLVRPWPGLCSRFLYNRAI